MPSVEIRRVFQLQPGDLVILDDGRCELIHERLSATRFVFRWPEPEPHQFDSPGQVVHVIAATDTEALVTLFTTFPETEPVHEQGE